MRVWKVTLEDKTAWTCAVIDTLLVTAGSIEAAIKKATSHAKREGLVNWYVSKAEEQPNVTMI